MAQDNGDSIDAADSAVALPEPGGRQHLRLALKIAAIIFALLLALAWLSRERIADDVISSQLDTLGLPATYRIESIGPGRQVLGSVVVGDPARPDLTIERVEVTLAARFGAPSISSVRLVRPRIYGAFRDGKASFGSLDKLIYGGKPGAPFRLPDMAVDIVDGRGLIESAQGNVGLKLAGKGNLRGGFTGELAAVAPRLEAAGCKASGATLYGTVRITGEQPRFMGPLRAGGLVCDSAGLRLARAAVSLDLAADKSLDGLDARLGLRGGQARLGKVTAAALGGTGALALRKGLLTVRYDLAAETVLSEHARMVRLALVGTLRGVDDLSRIDMEGAVTGRGFMPGAGIDQALQRAVATSHGTFAAPLLGKARAALAAQGANARLDGEFRFRRESGRDSGSFSLTVPRASLVSARGASLVSVSRLQVSGPAGGMPIVVGNVSTGGEGLPRIAGRMERKGGVLTMRLAMDDYAAGSARLAVPAMMLTQAANGALGFSGSAVLSGELPGGRAQGLHVPLTGNWSARSGLAIGRRCTPVSFDLLSIGSFTFDRRAITLCPPAGGAILRQDARGLRIAAGLPSLDLTGRMGGTPTRIASGPIGFAMPGQLSARALAITLGPPATASTFRIANLSARIGAAVAGRFDGADVSLAAVPLDIRGAAGAWQFANGQLSLSGADFMVEDRQAERRFAPLAARGATLVLADNRIIADAALFEPKSLREVLRTAVTHDLANGAGRADIAVGGVVFDEELQPDTLTPLALGVIANAEGVVRGSGRINWDERTVTSSGAFTTDSFDFAAAFGPVKGLSGTVAFTDLLGLVTAPHQTLRVASINPGIEVTEGTIDFELRPGSQLAVNGGTWPFLGGTLSLAPTKMNFGVAETRRYTLSISGLDGARLVQQMELGNVNVSGTFDGILPLVFDENGGHIEGGLLQSRPPGGNVSYIGELTYKDLSPMANFAFQTLRSLDYRQMRVEMEGPLEGEIITRINFDGIRQGTGARQNFLTRRIAALPIRFKVNITAPFFQLVTSVRSMYDPAYVRDPRSLGLIDEAGRPLSPPPSPAPSIQPSESGAVR